MIFSAQILEKIESLPTLSPVFTQVLEALVNDDAGIQDIVNIIQYDPALTAEILKMANSAYYQGAQETSSVQQAAMRLGLEQISRLVLVSSANKVIDKPIAVYDLPPGQLWRHSVGTALATRELCAEIDCPQSDTAFTAALLHDIGKLILAQFTDAEFALVEHAAMAQGISFEQAEREVLGLDHAEAGAVVLERWNLPSAIIDAVRWHHDPDGAESTSRTIDLVHLADSICISMGIGHGRDGLYYRPSATATARCGLTRNSNETVIGRTLTALHEFAEIFSLRETEVEYVV